jgi:hypothetical protein
VPGGEDAAHVAEDVEHGRAELGGHGLAQRSNAVRSQTGPPCAQLDHGA